VTAFLWFLAGLVVGLNVALAYAWLSLRRENRKAAPPTDPMLPYLMTMQDRGLFDMHDGEDRIDVTTKPWS
jgi:hypothetical protein